MNYQTFEKKAGETRTFMVDFSRHLEGTVRDCRVPPFSTEVIETLYGTPTVQEIGSSDLTISTAGINTDSRAFAGTVYPANRAVQFTVAGGTARRDYTIRVSVTTDSSPVQTLIEDVRLRVL